MEVNGINLNETRVKLQKIVTKRNNESLYLMLTHIILFYALKFFIDFKINNLELDFDNKYSLLDPTNDIQIDELFTQHHHQVGDVTEGFSLLLICSLTSVFVLTFLSLYRLKINFLYFVLSCSFLWLAYPFFEGGITDAYTIDAEFSYSSHLQFLLYIIVLIDYARGEKVDVYPIESAQLTKNMSVSLTELNALKEKGILTDDEYLTKQKEIKREKAMFEFKHSEDYQLLLSLKNKGIIDEDEFNQKVEKIISSGD